MRSLHFGLVSGVAVLSALSLSACATNDDIAKAVAPVDAQAQANAAEISRTQSELASTQGVLNNQGDQLGKVGGQVDQLGGQVSSLNGQVGRIGATAQEALDRAKAAGVLAEGKFMYSVVLTDDSIKFPANKAQLTPEAQARLDELVTRLKAENKNVYLEIQGYADATGSPQVNERLGAERAEAVRRYLSSHGVPLSRINTISYGEANPAAPNNTREGRAQNRRVVIQVLS